MRTSYRIRIHLITARSIDSERIIKAYNLIIIISLKLIESRRRQAAHELGKRSFGVPFEPFETLTV